MKKYLLIAGVSFAAAAGAVTLVPNTFTPGTPIKSADVNANFSSLQANAVDHEARLQVVEAAMSAKPADQLICTVYSNWATGGTAFPCLQASNPASLRSLTMEQVLAEGWASVAVGGGDNGNRLVMTFRK